MSLASSLSCEHPLTERQLGGLYERTGDTEGRKVRIGQGAP